MARITFEIDQETKRQIKSRLGKDGLKIKEVFGDFCNQYADFGLSPGQFIKWDDRNSLPHCSAVYFIIDSNGEILYIGATKALKKRMGAHDKWVAYSKCNASIFWLEVPEDLMFSVEEQMIYIVQPQLNYTFKSEENGEGQMVKRTPGRPPKHESGAMVVYRLRVPEELKAWLDQTGTDATRNILENAKRRDEESGGAPNVGDACRECGAEGCGAGFCILCGGVPE